jgi:hypothetical protein
MLMTLAGIVMLVSEVVRSNA